MTCHELYSESILVSNSKMHLSGYIQVVVKQNRKFVKYVEIDLKCLKWTFLSLDNAACALNSLSLKQVFFFFALIFILTCYRFFPRFDLAKPSAIQSNLGARLMDLNGSLRRLFVKRYRAVFDK